MIPNFHGDKYGRYKNSRNKKPGMQTHPGYIFV